MKRAKLFQKAFLVAMCLAVTFSIPFSVSAVEYEESTECGVRVAVPSVTCSCGRMMTHTGSSVKSTDTYKVEECGNSVNDSDAAPLYGYHYYWVKTYEHSFSCSNCYATDTVESSEYGVTTTCGLH